MVHVKKHHRKNWKRITYWAPEYVAQGQISEVLKEAKKDGYTKFAREKNKQGLWAVFAR